MLQQGREIAAGLASVEERIREGALARLREALPDMPEETFRPLCIGLYYYFWYCDGPERQERAAAEIAAMEARVGGSAWAWRRTLIGVLVKFWDRLDYHRANKYLNLFREVFQFVYNGVFAAQRRKDALKEWNAYLAEALLADERAKPLLLELVYVAGRDLLPAELPAPLLFLFCKPFFDLRCFNRDRVLRNAVTAHFFPAVEQRVGDAAVRQRLAGYLRSYAAAPEIPFEARRSFTELVARLEGDDAGRAEPPRIDAEELPPTEAEPEPAMQEPEAQEHGAETQRSEQGQELWAGLPLEAAGEEDAEELREAEEESDFLAEDDLFTPEEELLMAEDDEAIEDLQALGADGGYLSLEELQQSVPPYYFKTAKQKRKFFSRMNRDYFASMEAGAAKKIRKETPGVKFNLGQTQVHRFRKNQIINA